MPTSVSLPIAAPVRAIHLLGGISGWGYPATRDETTSLVVRLVYADGTTEDHPLKNGRHFADYIRRVDVPESDFAFDLAGRQMRYLAIRPARDAVIERIDLVKGNDPTAPVVMAMSPPLREPARPGERFSRLLKGSIIASGCIRASAI